MLEKNIAVAVLAAGHGSFDPEKSKLVEIICEQSETSIIKHAVKPFRELGLPIYIVHNDSYRVQIRGEFPDFEDVQFACQRIRNGTAGAVTEIICHFSEEGLYYKYDNLLVIHGDMPLLRKETLSQLIEKHVETNATITVLTITTEIDELPESIKKYARVIRDQGRIANIVEPAGIYDFAQGQKQCTVFPSVWMFRIPWLRENLIPVNLHLFPHTKNDGYSPEFWLLDLVKIAHSQKEKIYELTISDVSQVVGINTKADLELAKKILCERKKAEVL